MTNDLSRRFRDAPALVTGAASGIGLALATRLAEAGARVVLADLDGEAAERRAEALRRRDLRAVARRLDVCDREDFARAVREIEEREGSLEYLFNNAGIGVGGEARDFGPVEWDSVVDVNLGGVIHGVLAAYPGMVARGRGHLVNVASVAGLVPFPGEISYTASKWAVVGLTQTLRIEAAALGVKVTLVCPGKVETPIYETSRILGFDRHAVLALWPKGVTPERCAEEVLDAVLANRAIVVVTGAAKLLWWLERLSPALVEAIGRLYLRRLRAHRLPSEGSRA